MTKRTIKAQLKRTKRKAIANESAKLLREECLNQAKIWSMDDKIRVVTTRKFYPEPVWLEAFAALSLGSLASDRSKYLCHSHRGALQNDANALASDFRRLVVNSYISSKKSAYAQ